MLKITFKDVGQGDTIFLEWKEEKTDKIGLIDCNLRGKDDNPALDFLKSKSIEEIEFILLSHPHFDHFSGMREILDYCEESNIRINYFLHTSQQVPDYLKVAATKTKEAEKELAHLFKKVRELWKEKNLIKKQNYVSDFSNHLRLNESFAIQFLAPSTIEFDNYITGVKVFSDEESAHNTANANWLSTLIKIYGKDWYILLTSDCEKKTLQRVGIKEAKDLKGTLIFGQSPHHGARGNHYNAFWKNRSFTSRMPIIFSVGQNHYKHPSENALNDFRKLGFKLYSTNQVGSLLDEKATSEIVQTTLLLDMVSTQTQLKSRACINDLSGDQVFLIDNNGKVIRDN